MNQYFRTPSESSNSDPSWTNPRNGTLLIVLLTVGGAFWTALFPIRGENDPWWHLKTGQILWEYFQTHGWFHFPPFDVFTYTGGSTPWVNHEWLSELIFYFAYRLGGIQGALIFKSLIFALTIVLMMGYMRRMGTDWILACLGALMVTFACQTTLSLRPPVFTYLFIVIFMHGILSLRRKEHFAWVAAGLIAAEVIWVNLHGGAIIGMILVGFWWASELWHCFVDWFREHPAHPSFPPLGTASWVLAAVTLASLINPFTYHIHLLTLKVTSDPMLLQNIGELQAPRLEATPIFKIVILGMFLLSLLRARSIQLCEGFAILFFGQQSLNHMRHIPLFALVAIPPICAAWAAERQMLIPPNRSREDCPGLWGLLSRVVRWLLAQRMDLLVVFLLVFFTFGIRPATLIQGWTRGMAFYFQEKETDSSNESAPIFSPQTFWERNLHDFPYFLSDGYIPGRYPEKAVNFMVRYQLPGPMFNHDNFAGYLIWRLSPEKYKLFTDSRYDLWGSRYAKEELSVFGARALPLGGYTQTGEWIPFRDVTRREQLATEIMRNGTFPELVDWYQSGKPYWQYVLDQYQANFLIMFDIEGLQYLLSKEFLGWFPVFHEGGYIIYLRDDPRNDFWLQKFALDFRDHLRKS